MKYLKYFEGINRDLEILLQINNGKELKDFFRYFNYVNYEDKFDFDKLIIIDNGMHGIIFTYAGNNDYYKLTYDKNTYLLCRKLVGKKFNHLIDIKDVDVITNKHIGLYIISMEECVPIPESIFIVLENLNHEIISYIKDMETQATDFSDDNNFDNYYTKEDALKELVRYLWEDEKISDEDWIYFEEINLINQFKEIKTELQNIGFTKYNLDIHHGNVMMKKGTQDLCLIDFISTKNF